MQEIMSFKCPSAINKFSANFSSYLLRLSNRMLNGDLKINIPNAFITNFNNASLKQLAIQIETYMAGIFVGQISQLKIDILSNNPNIVWKSLSLGMNVIQRFLMHGLF